MKLMRSLRFYLILGLLISAISACKLDDSAVPAHTGSDPSIIPDQLVLGISINGQIINDSYLTANWKTVKTIEQYFDTSYVTVSGTYITNKFNTVTLNDKTKAATYTGLTTGTVADATYKLSTANNVLYIQLSSDVFSRTNNTPVRITNLTSTSMTWWAAIDTPLIHLNGKVLRKAYQVTFIK